MPVPEKSSEPVANSAPSRRSKPQQPSPIDPPADAIIPERGPHAPAPGEPITSHYPDCFGCGEKHPTGLHMAAVAGEGLSVRAEFEVTQFHQGAPGLAHGGLLACAFDEALGGLHWLIGQPAVTARLETDFISPVPVGAAVQIDAEVTGVLGRKVYCQAVGRLGGSDGPVVLRSKALFIQVDREHFRSHGWSDVVDEVARIREKNQGSRHVEVNP